jgi:undecaprenyl diphosphate synthase
MIFKSSTTAVPETPAVPRHIAIIMDGNGRWATKRLLPRVAGHVKGVEAVRGVVEACATRGIEYLTLFAFSSENWRRPEEEVSLLMRLFVTALEREVAKMHANNIRLKVVGDLSRFDPKLQDMIANAERKTANNTRLTVTVCANYGGRWDIMQATSKMVAANPGITEYAERCWPRTWRWPMRPSPTCSSAPAGKSASPTSCCGSSRIRSSTSPTRSGLIFPANRWTRRSRPTSNANAASARPANKSQRRNNRC